MSSVQLMCNASGVLQGYAILELDCETGLPTYRYQALNTTTTSTSKTAGWQPCCTESSSAGTFPMFTDGSTLSTLAGYVFIRYDAETATYQQQYVTLAGVVTATKPSGWEQGDCAAVTGGGGGGGGGDAATVPGSVHLYLSSGTVLNNKKYPDWGQPGLADASRVDTLSIPCGYDGGDWCRLVVTVYNVQAALASALQVTLKDLTNAVDVATLTFAAAASPTSTRLWAQTTIASGSFTDDTRYQWHVVTAQDGNAFGLHAEAFYTLSVDAT